MPVTNYFKYKISIIQPFDIVDTFITQAPQPPKKADRAPQFSGLEFGAELAVERIRPAAAQRDREAQEAPHQRLFVAAVEPAEAVFQYSHVMRASSIAAAAAK